MNRYILFDRDGTLIDHVHHLHELSKVRIKRNALEAALRLSQMGYAFGLVTNQSVIERGIASPTTVESINNYIVGLFERVNVKFDYVRYCPHVEQSRCECRKPMTAMVRDLLERKDVDFENSYMVGDSLTDVLFGNNIGFKSILISDYDYSEGLAYRVVKDISHIPSLLQEHEC